MGIVQELLNSVLDCLNETIRSLDKSMFYVTVDLIQCYTLYVWLHMFEFPRDVQDYQK